MDEGTNKSKEENLYTSVAQESKFSLLGVDLFKTVWGTSNKYLQYVCIKK